MEASLTTENTVTKLLACQVWLLASCFMHFCMANGASGNTLIMKLGKTPRYWRFSDITMTLESQPASQPTCKHNLTGVTHTQFRQSNRRVSNGNNFSINCNPVFSVNKVSISEASDGFLWCVQLLMKAFELYFTILFSHFVFFALESWDFLLTFGGPDRNISNFWPRPSHS